MVSKIRVQNQQKNFLGPRLGYHFTVNTDISLKTDWIHNWSQIVNENLVFKFSVQAFQSCQKFIVTS